MEGGSALYVGLGGVLGAGKRFFLALSSRLFSFMEGGFELLVGRGGVMGNFMFLKLTNCFRKSIFFAFSHLSERPKSFFFLRVK
jgi:hypothetical protein